MYSGSTSLAKSISGKILTPRSRNSASCPLNAVKSAVTTLACSTPASRSIMLTDPSGLIVGSSSSGSPSLATKTLVPSGVKVTMSGNAPTVTLFNMLPSTSKKTTLPASCADSPSMAAAIVPSLIAMLLIPPPNSSISIAEVKVGLVGSLTSKISIVLEAALITNSC